MLAQHARRAARLVDGELVTLEHQDRSRWDGDAVDEALALTMSSRRHAGELPPPGRARPHPPARRGRGRHRLAPDRRPLRRLLDLHPSPVVALNRAVAVGMAEGPAADCCCSTTSPSSPRSRTCTCCRPPAPTCSPGPAGPTRQSPSSTGRSSSHPTDQERRQLAAASRRARAVGRDQSSGRSGRSTISVNRRCRSRASHSPVVSSMQLDSSTVQISSRVLARAGSITSTLIS